jgi:hypothetical protein
MRQELESVEKNRTWELVGLPAGHYPNLAEMGVQAQDG